MQPFAIDRFLNRDERVRFEGIRPLLEWSAGWELKLIVTLAHYGESVLVKPKPDVQPVLFDPIADAGIPGTRPFSPEPPSQLINRDFVIVLPIWSAGDFKRGRQGGNPATEDCDLFLHACFSVSFFFSFL